jgi:DNA primase
LAGSGSYIGVAALGTSLTDEQASQLVRQGTNPIVATDGDIAGRVDASMLRRIVAQTLDWSCRSG